MDSFWTFSYLEYEEPCKRQQCTSAFEKKQNQTKTKMTAKQTSPPAGNVLSQADLGTKLLKLFLIYLVFFLFQFCFMNPVFASPKI